MLLAFKTILLFVLHEYKFQVWYKSQNARQFNALT